MTTHAMSGDDVLLTSSTSIGDSEQMEGVVGRLGDSLAKTLYRFSEDGNESAEIAFTFGWKKEDLLKYPFAEVEVYPHTSEDAPTVRQLAAACKNLRRYVEPLALLSGAVADDLRLNITYDDRGRTIILPFPSELLHQIDAALDYLDKLLEAING